MNRERELVRELSYSISALAESPELHNLDAKFERFEEIAIGQGIDCKDSLSKVIACESL